MSTSSINWRPYFLNDWIPRDGIDRQTYLETKFGSVERYGVIAERIVAAAAMEGLVYNPDKIGRQPNTLDCHRLILWSRSATDPGRMKQRLMELYFAEGADLTDPRVLIQAAVDCGMDGDLVRRLLASDADVDRIEGEATSAPKKPASTACRASSSARASSSPARSRRNISPAPSSAPRAGTPGCGPSALRSRSALRASVGKQRYTQGSRCCWRIAKR